MTTEEMKSQVSARTGETDDGVLTSYLDDAAQAILNHVYPFRDDVETVPTKYQRRQIEIAVYLLNKRGAEGETVHKENGTDRTYESANIPASLFEGIMPYCKIPTEDDDEDTES